MSEKHRIARTADLAENGDRAITEIDGVEIAVFNLNGEYHAIANYCIHAGGPLCEGDLVGRHTFDPSSLEWEYDPEERNIACPWHGWLFDVETGQSIDDARYRVPTYETLVENGIVYVRR